MRAPILTSRAACSRQSLGSLLLLATLVKHGSYLTVVVVAEPPLLCLAACAVAATLRERSRARTVVVAAALTLAVVQVASLVVAPANPSLFTRPLAASGPARAMTSDEVAAAAAELRRCPDDSAYGGAPYLAFVAGREIAGSQPDQFIVSAAPILAEFRRTVEAEPAICPGRLPAR